MPHPFFDAPYFVHDGAGKELYDKLCQIVFDREEIARVYAAVNADLSGMPVFSKAVDTWREILDLFAIKGQLPKLFDHLESDYHELRALVQAVRDIPDPVQAHVLPDKSIVLDRKLLRDHLTSMNSYIPVLVIRGARHTGKSHTAKLVRHAFNPPNQVYEVNARLDWPYSVFVRNLARKIWPAGKLDPMYTSESANYLEVAGELLAFAEQREALERRWTVLWIIVDDLNDQNENDANRPRLADCQRIRDFLDVFVNALQNSSDYGRYFRLVLIDYPEKPLRHWPEDIWREERPDPAHIDSKLVSDVLQRHIRGTLPDDTAAQMANEILARDASAATPWLRQVHDRARAALFPS